MRVRLSVKAPKMHLPKTLAALLARDWPEGAGRSIAMKPPRPPEEKPA